MKHLESSPAPGIEKTLEEWESWEREEARSHKNHIQAGHMIHLEGGDFPCEASSHEILLTANTPFPLYEQQEWLVDHRPIKTPPEDVFSWAEKKICLPYRSRIWSYKLKIQDSLLQQYFPTQETLTTIMFPLNAPVCPHAEPLWARSLITNAYKIINESIYISVLTEDGSIEKISIPNVKLAVKQSLAGEEIDGVCIDEKLPEFWGWSFGEPIKEWEGECNIPQFNLLRPLDFHKIGRALFRSAGTDFNVPEPWNKALALEQYPQGYVPSKNDALNGVGSIIPTPYTSDQIKSVIG